MTATQETEYRTSMRKTQGIAADSKLNYEDGWDAIVSMLIRKFGYDTAKEMVLESEKLNNEYYEL